MIDGKLIEGHVPVAQIRELKTRDDLAGIAVPGMPAGSPGMNYGQPHQRYQVIALTVEGRDQVLADYLGSQPVR
ncbi:metal-binding protein [Pseudomonas sp. BAY1663]|nr:metal-binding protein [Pseudomonas sp. BAY1663]